MKFKVFKIYDEGSDTYKECIGYDEINNLTDFRKYCFDDNKVVLRMTKKHIEAIIIIGMLIIAEYYFKPIRTLSGN